MLRIVFIITVLLGLVGLAGVGGVLLYGKQQFEAPGPAAAEGAEETIVLLDKGLGLKRIASRLERAGVLSDKRIFEVAVRLQGAGGDLKAGEYAIPSRASMADILDILRSGQSILHKLTVAEGLAVVQVLDLINEHDALTGEIAETPREGTLLPETYLFQRGTARAELLDDMIDAKQDVLDALWDDRADDLPFSTQFEALIIASIVEKETGVAEERPLVASVFVNRMRRGMRLQSDPTIIYGITQGRPLGRRIRLSELRSDDPYNTYTQDGLPPTPIANAGRAALEAVLNPPSTDYYYFVADGTGGHVFASTLEEHNRNVAAWRRVQRERGLR